MTRSKMNVLRFAVLLISFYRILFLFFLFSIRKINKRKNDYDSEAWKTNEIETLFKYVTCCEYVRNKR